MSFTATSGHSSSFLKGNSMKYLLAAMIAVAPALAGLASPAVAQESSYTPGGYWIVQGVYVEPGQFENYADYLADRYARSQNYAKQQGWITGYRMMVNVNKRNDEPDMYLISELPRLATPQEQIDRDKMMAKALAETTRQAEEGSGKRVSMRRLGSNTLLQEMLPRAK